MEETFKAKKKRSIRAAKDLCYDKKYISQLENAVSESQLYRILKTARKEKFDLN